MGKTLSVLLGKVCDQHGAATIAYIEKTISHRLMDEIAVKSDVSISGGFIRISVGGTPRSADALNDKLYRMGVDYNIEKRGKVFTFLVPVAKQEVCISCNSKKVTVKGELWCNSCFTKQIN